MISYAKTNDIPALKTMWALCFADTPEFIDFYFTNIFRLEETPVYYDNGIPVAALQLIPYPVKLGDQTYPAGYISGAMTHPGHRNKGLMKQLLLFSFEVMKKRQIPLSFLIPQEEWLFGFYEKFGYRPAFPKAFQTVPPSDNDSSGVEYGSPRNFSFLYPSYYSFLEQQENVVLKTSAQFEAILEDLYIDGGLVFSVNSGKQGIAFAVPETNSVLVKELFYINEDIKRQILSAIQKAFPHQTIQCVVRHLDKNTHLFGMIKILDDTLFPNSLPTIYMSMMLD